MFSKKFTNIFIFFLYLSLLCGFFLKEDLIGGALNDYKGLFYVTEKFRENFLVTLLNYDDLGHRQSPVFYILSSLIPKSELLNRLFFIHVFLIIPIFFYKCLKFSLVFGFLPVLSFLWSILNDPTFFKFN